PMTASVVPTATVSSSATLIATTTPAAGEGISVSTLSVETSSSGSSASTLSPTDFSQRVTVPSVTDSPSAGSTTGVPLAGPDGAAGAGPAGAGAGAACSGCGAWAAAGAGAAAGASCAGAEAAGAGASPGPPITASSAPTSTVSSSATLIDSTTPAAGEGISVSTLSVETSSSGSSTSTVSPSFFSHRVTVPSVTDSPSAGIVTDVGMSFSPDYLRSRVRGRGLSVVHVQRLAGQGHVRLAQRLALRRVGVHELRDVARRGVPVVDQLRLGHQLAGPVRDDVHADHPVVLARDARDLHQLDLALGLEDLALAVAREVVVERLHVVRAVPLLGDGLGDPAGGDLRLRVRHARHAVVVDRARVQPGDVLGDQDALAEADVRELQRRNEVADRVHARGGGLAELVDLHVAAVHDHAGLLEAEVRGHRAAADRDQQQLGLEGLPVLGRDAHAGLCVFDPGEPVAELELDAAAAERALQQLRVVLVLQRHQVRQRLDDGDLGAEGLPDRGEFAADDAAAEHDDRARDAIELERVVAADDPVAVDIQAGQRLGYRTGCQHDVAAGVGLAVHSHLIGRAQHALAGHEGDLAGLHNALQALVQLADHAVLVAVDPGHVDAVELALHAERRALAGQVGDFGRVQQRLGGDAAAVQAGAAHLGLLDQGHVHAQVGGAEGAGVPAGPAAEDHYVEHIPGVSHLSSPR